MKKALTDEGSASGGMTRIAMRFLGLNCVAALLLGVITMNAAQAAGFECRQSPLVRANMQLPDLARAIAGDHELDILAIGSSSTEGVGASAPDKTYPARLQALLRQAWPNVSVNVTNAGIGGETAPQTILRLQKAVVERSYDLVIWQVGTNDAVNGGDLEAFKGMVRDGIAAVQKAGPSLVLLDPQYFPSVRDPQRYQRFVRAIAETAEAYAAPVLSRYDAMLGWHRH